MFIEPLTGVNCPQWRQKINLGLAIFLRLTRPLWTNV
jgi:hypothetical protein